VGGLQQEKHKNGGDGGGSLISTDRVAPSQMVGVSASVIFPCTIEDQKISSGTDSPGWSSKKGHKTVVCVCVFPGEPVPPWVLLLHLFQKKGPLGIRTPGD